MATGNTAPPELINAMLRLRATRDQDTKQRLIAAPFFAAAGFANSQLPTNLLPQYDDPRQFELAKLEAKKSVLKMQQEMAQARLQYGSALAGNLKTQRTNSIDLLKAMITAKGLNADRYLELTKNLNDNITELNKARIGSMFRGIFSEGGANAGISATGVVRFLDNVLEPADNARGEEETLEVIWRQIEIEKAMVDQEVDPEAKARAEKTLAVSLQAVDSMLRETRGFGIEDLATQFSGSNVKAASVLEAWNEHKDYSGPETENMNIELLKMGAESIREASDELYRRLPAGDPVTEAFAAYDKLVKKNDLTFDEKDQNLTKDLDEAMETLSPQEKYQANYDALDKALEDIDRLSPNLSPGSLKARFFDPKQPEGKMFFEWMTKNGYNTSAPEVAWKALRREVGLLKSKAAAENRAISRERAAGGGDLSPAAPQAAASMDSTAAPTSQAPEQGPVPQPTIPGNIDLDSRPVVKNPDGSISTVVTISVGVDGVEYLIPTIADDGRQMTDEEAKEQFRKTGNHLGGFKSPEEATAYAKNLSKEMGVRKGADEGPAQMGTFYRFPAGAAIQTIYYQSPDGKEFRRADAEETEIAMAAVDADPTSVVSDDTKFMEAWQKAKGGQEPPAAAPAAAPTKPQEAPAAPAQPEEQGRSPYGAQRALWDVTHPSFTAQRWMGDLKEKRKQTLGAKLQGLDPQGHQKTEAMKFTPEMLQDALGDPEKLRKLLGLTEEEEVSQ